MPTAGSFRSTRRLSPCAAAGPRRRSPSATVLTRRSGSGPPSGRPSGRSRTKKSIVPPSGGKRGGRRGGKGDHARGAQGEARPGRGGRTDRDARAEVLRGGASAWGDQHPPYRGGCARARDASGQVGPDRRVLLEQGVPELAAGGEEARHLGLRERLRLRGGQAGLDRGRPLSTESSAAKVTG